MLKINYNKSINLCLNELNLSLDPISKSAISDINFVSHAHKDHISKNTKENSIYFGTKPTLDIAEILFNDQKQSKILEFNKNYKIDNLSYKIINSGHILGSYSLVLEYNGSKITITSDINTYNTTTTKATIPEDTDILIIESTYGSEKDIFPKRDEEYSKLLRWILLNSLNNKLPIISAYTLGKTQEILKLICDNTNLKTGLTNEAYDICNIYEKNNIKLKNYEKINGNVNELDLMILPPSKINKSYIHALSTICKKDITFASTTGLGLNFGQQFKISDHSDFNGLINYIKESNAKTIYTYHGKDVELSLALNKKLNKFSKPLREIKKIEII